MSACKITLLRRGLNGLEAWPRGLVRAPRRPSAGQAQAKAQATKRRPPATDHGGLLGLAFNHAYAKSLEIGTHSLRRHPF